MSLKDRKAQLKVPKDFGKLPSAARVQFFKYHDDFVQTQRELTIAALYLLRKAQRPLPDDVTRNLVWSRKKLVLGE